MAKTIAVIDGNSLMHRAYHAVPPTMNAPDGTPTNAVFGFLSMFLKFIDIAHPDGVVCAFDEGKPEFRIKALEQYKAQRPHMDEELRVQFPIMEDLLHAMNIPVVKVKGWEGDDILGTIAARDEALGYETLLVTGDKDAYQLASDTTRIVTTRKGMTDIGIYGPDEVFEKYGVTPEQFTDFLGLMGDSSDNIPGVPGIGPKSATKLLQTYGTMQGVYDAIDELKGKQRENLENNEEAAFLSKKIATIVTDLDFPLDLEEVSFPSYEPVTVEEAFGRYALHSHLGKILGLVGGEVAPAPALELSWEPVYEQDEAWEAFEHALEEGKLFGVAVIDPSQRADASAQASLFDPDPELLAAFATDTFSAVLEGERAYRALAALIAKGTFATPEVKDLVHRVFPADTALEALVTPAEVLDMDAFDLGLAGYVLQSSEDEYTLESLVAEYTGGALPDAGEGELARAARDAAAARALIEPLRKALAADGSDDIFFRIDLPLVGVLACMERVGVEIDVPLLKEIGAGAQAELDALSQEIYALAGEEFSINSPKQLGHILFEVLGLPAKKKNSRGYSTDASVLKELAKDHELPALVLRYRELAKITSTYIDALPPLRAGDGRIHTRFNEKVTTTGRLSSSNPNLQNIPVRTDFGRNIRRCFVPLREGDVFMSADYSQIELRLLAHLSKDPKLQQAFLSGADFHAATAAHVFGLPVEEVTPQLRSRAKAVNFGIVYGQQAFGLSQSLDIPFGEAKDIIDSYFIAYPGVREYLDRTVDEAKKNGYAVTIDGRKRHIKELLAKNPTQRGFGERTAMNHPMQGSAADIIKLAMVEVQRRLVEGGFEAKLMLQVHDELDLSVPDGEVEAVAALVKDVMENVVKLDVPLIADVSWGSNWEEAH